MALLILARDMIVQKTSSVKDVTKAAALGILPASVMPVRKKRQCGANAHATTNARAVKMVRLESAESASGKTESLIKLKPLTYAANPKMSLDGT